MINEIMMKGSQNSSGTVKVMVQQHLIEAYTSSRMNSKSIKHREVSME